MKHVPPHRWADVFAGRVDGSERAELEQHAEQCESCRRNRARVQRASDSFTAIRNQSSPDLSWDAVRAKVHWTVSSERRARREHGTAAPRSRRPWIAVGAVAAAGLTAAIVAPRPAPPEVAVAPPGRIAPVPEVRPPAPAALVGLVNRATGEVMLDGIRAKDLFERRLAAGTTIATSAGEVDIQFGTASAFRLGPHSTLQLRRFDADAVELVVDGRVDLEVAPRANGQRFVVHAGERAIEVRGTQFRVEHAGGATAVACRHGLVEVRDRDGTAMVAGERRLQVVRGRRVADVQPVPLTADELATLDDATPTTLPVWDLTALATSAPLELASGGRRHVRVDGIELGAAPLRVRVMPGRHTVEAADSRGRYRRAGWIDVTAGTHARLEVTPEPSPTAGVDTRRRQLRAGLDRAQVDACTRKLRKQGITGTYVQIEIGVDAQGAINFLNVLDTDMGQTSAQCIRDVLRGVAFKPGPAAQWRERLDL